MRLMGHIFKKDARRLWWEIAISLAALALLTMYDSTRVDAVPGPVEGYLNLLLFLAWGLVAALLIHDEALVGDRQFWVTRPYPRAALVGAKALGLVAFIHLPYLVSHGAIVAARGFNPLGYLPPLMWKQLLLAVAFTLPVAALAAVTRNLIQFVPAVVTLLVAAILLTGGGWPMWFPYRASLRAKGLIPLCGLAVAAIVVFCLQYARRRTLLARSLAAVALLAAGLAFSFLPPEFVFRVQCLLDGAPVQEQPTSAGLAVDTEREGRRDWLDPAGAAILSIPLRVSGLGQPDGTGIVAMEQLELHVLAPNGEMWTAGNRFNRLGRDGTITFSPPGTITLRLVLGRPFFDRVKETGVTIRGKVGIALYRGGAGHTIPAISDSRPVAGVGRCYSMTEEYPEPGALKTVCESPSRLPFYTRVNLVQADGREVWPQRLYYTSRMGAYLNSNVLSPMYRSQIFFHLTDLPRREGSKWLVPSDVPATATVALVSGERTGSMVFRYEIRNVVFAQFAGRIVR